MLRTQWHPFHCHPFHCHSVIRRSYYSFILSFLTYCRNFRATGDGLDQEKRNEFLSLSQAAACLSHTVEASHCFFLMLNAKLESC